MNRCMFGALLLLAAGAAQADGRRLVASCAACHGTDGKAVGTTLPRLAGQSETQLIAAMRAFRDGSRPATIMHQIAKGYTDAQIAQMAAYLAQVDK